MNANYDAIKKHYAGSASGDIGAMMAPLTSRTEWVEMAGFPYAGTYVGPDAVIEGVFARIGRDWADFRFNLERLIDGGDVVAGIGTYSGTNRKTGRSLAARVVHTWTMREGKVIRFEQFTDTHLFAQAMT